MASYDASIASSLQKLAALGIGDLSNLAAVGLPSPWSLIGTTTGQGAQAYTAIGQLYGSSNQIALVLGAEWTSFLNAYAINGQYLIQQTVSNQILSDPTGDTSANAVVRQMLAMAGIVRRWAEGEAACADIDHGARRALGGLLKVDLSVPTESGSTVPSFDGGIQMLYLNLRSKIWSLVQQAASLLSHVDQTDLLICGQGVGAALADLAAYDLRPDKTGISPTIKFQQIRMYTFSPPALANAQFESLFATSIPDAWRVSAGTTTTVDFFPTEPALTGLGAAQPQAATLPEVDAPWWERSGTFYTDVLNDTKTPTTVTGAGSTTATGYSADLAYTLSQLCAAAAERAQHPGLSPSIPSSWSLKNALPTDNPWVSIFFQSSPKAYAVVFRTGTTFEETAQSLVDVGPSTLTWLSAGSASMHAGAYKIYTDTLRDDLRSLLTELDWSDDASLYVAGHSLGAMIAAVAAVDLDQNPINGAPTAQIQTYAFGSPAAAGYSLIGVVPALLSRIFLVGRNQDAVAKVNWNSFLARYGTAITLSGDTSYDEQTYHAINAYIALLDPRG